MNDRDIDARLNELRNLMGERKLSAYIIPTDDFHSSEYVGVYFKAREYMSGFTGSAGTLVVLPDQAALWTDGRYFLQAAQQLAGSAITLMRAGQPGVPTIAGYLRDSLETKSVIGFDGRTVTERFVGMIAEKTGDREIGFKGDEDLVDMVWRDRPPISTEQVWELADVYTGRSRDEKLAAVREKMSGKGADALLLTALDEIAWLLNLRGHDVAYTPVFLAYMLITRDSADLYVHEQILTDEIRAHLMRSGIAMHPYDEIEQRLQDIPAGSRVWADGGSVNYRLIKSLPADIERIDQRSPVAYMKAVKTSQEMEHIRAAHVKDGVAVTKFIYWLKTHGSDKAIAAAGGERVTELAAARKLEDFRRQAKSYLEPSFAPIIASGSHGAVVHYEPTVETDAVIEKNSFCLADTGGHYMEGTTDVTRTIAVGEVSQEAKRYYTIALRGHLNLGAARFVYGVTGQNLDVLARGPLWEVGMDYNHGTGHGVGYLLNVHEGPQRFHWRSSPVSPDVPLEEGMVISNEPGIYLEGQFGIRHENLVLCRKGEQNEYGQFMYLEPLTMVPFDRDAILTELLTDRELELLNDYHRVVYETLAPCMDGAELDWLRQATMALKK